MRLERIVLPALCLLLAVGAATGETPPAGVRGGKSEHAVPAAEDPAKPRNTVRWTTASEMDNFGFDVYRGKLEKGPFVRLTKRPILGAGTSDTPQRYSWVDDTIDPRRVYFYYVESISMSGERRRFTPIIRAPAKKPSATPTD